jgi:hypothetical protein
VIDEYMRQGQVFAKNLWPAAGGAPVTPDPQRLIERMGQYASDFASVWLEYTQATMGQVPFAPASGAGPHVHGSGHVGGVDVGTHSRAEPPRQPRPAAKAATEPAAAEAPSVSVDIVSKGRAEVTVELKPGSSKASLAAHDLRARDPQLPRLSGVLVEGHASENRVAIRLSVPEDQPEGTYSGLIVDNESNLPMGMLSVSVLRRE